MDDLGQKGLALYLFLCAVIGPALYLILNRSAQTPARNVVLTIPTTLLLSGIAYFVVLVFLARIL